VDAEDLEFFTAVGSAAAAGVAVRVVDIRLDGAAVAGFHICHAVADGEDFDTQLVAQNARIGDEGHLPEVGADVRATDADAVDANESFSGTGG
jgi:hypothetical protein